VQLGDILVPVSRPEAVSTEKTYDLLGAHWYAEGLYTKEVKTGAEIRASRVFRVEEGDFVYNRLFAWKGSFAIAMKENHGCYVSNEFPCFVVRDDRLNRQYLRRYFSQVSAWEEALGLSSGGTPTSRNRLKVEKLLAMKIPLPPLSEQQRIVARIEELAARLEEARGLRRQAVEETEALRRAVVFSSDQGKARLTKMNELVSLRQPDVSVVPHETYHFAGVYSFGRGVFRGDVKTGMEFHYPRLTRISEGNFIYPKLMAWEGALGIVPKECDGLVVSPEFPVFDVDASKVLPETLDVYFRTASVWPQLSGTSTGTNVRRRRLNPKTFLDYEFPLPPMTVQEQLRVITSKLNPSKKMQAETAAELDALLPSVLDRAFRGEL